ncbi:hypothetical protein AX16_005480 [Volvariella volvacea WC 439]|nr:hypothetical protein AX16_005480 [Volvariella volvacea WC 439]
MRYLSFLVFLLSFISFSVSHFIDPDYLLGDGDILNYALGIQQLGHAFYRQGLKDYSKDAFRRAGYPDWVRDRFQQIASHEKTHIKFLTTSLNTTGQPAVRPCHYYFPHSNPRSFVELSAIISNVATSAFNGMLPFVNDKGYLTAFGSILGVQARHAGWINSALLWVNPWNTAFETPLDANQARSWFSTFIVSCPGPNFLSPSKSFSKLALPANALPGATVELQIIGDALSSEANKDKYPYPRPQLYLHCLTGTGIYTSVVDMPKKQVTIPNGIRGAAYCLVSKDKEKATDASTVAGPAVVMCPFEADGRLHE